MENGMNIWAMMITALRGGINEAGEAVVDNQALRILDQEVREATEELKQTRDGLASILAKQKSAEAKARELKKHIEEFESYAIKALEQGDETLALEVAEKVVSFENDKRAEQDAANTFAESADDLRRAIKTAEQNIKRLRQQVDTVKATESVQRAQAAIAQRHGGPQSKLRTAMDSLERIREKQVFNAAKIQVAAELAEDQQIDSLKQRLQNAGIAPKTPGAIEVLERLKKQQVKS